MKRLYFCRHGQSVRNMQQIYSGQFDTPLTEIGREQAKLAGASQATFDIVVASPLSRALETAQIIAREKGYPLDDIIVNHLFMERSLGSLEGLPFSTGPEDPKLFPSIEPDEAFATRAEKALEYVRSLEAENVLVVAHGSFGVALRTALDPTILTAELPNAKIVQLV